jgi:hypothetical protein
MSSQQHVHEFNHHHPSHFDHVLAGLHHLKVTHRERINKLEQEHEDTEIQRAVLMREFQKHADIHNVWYQHLEGYEDKTYPIESQMETARHYFWGMIGGMLIAVVLGVYFSTSTLMADSFLLLVIGSVVVACGIGILASVILRALLGASAVKPHASSKVNFTLVAVGITFFLLLTAFAWLRFQSASPMVAFLPAIMVGMELTAIIFAGACDCGYRMYRWSGVFHERHRHLLHRKSAVEDLLANKHVDLLSIEHRIKEHEEAHAHEEGHVAEHHGTDHTEEHHENHYETIHH